MASRKLIVEIIGDDKSLQRAFNRSTTSATRFGVAVDKVNKRAGAVSGIFGRGGGALLGTAALTAAVRSAVKAAQEQEVVLGQTRQAVEAAGLAWGTYADRVDEAADRISVATAFDDEAVLRSFQLLVRGSGNVEEALGRVELAADVARARYIDLEQATMIVNKAALGQIGALRRLGIQIDTNATSTEALALLQEKFGGSAARFAESSAASTERLAVAFENLQESLGTLLLPLVAQLADHLTDAALAADKLVKGLEGISNVRVPTIRVPIVGEFGGGKAGDLVKSLLGDFTPKDILIPVRVVRAIRGGDDDPATSAIESVGTALEKKLKVAQAALAKLQNQAAGDVFGGFIAAVQKVIAATNAAIAKAAAHEKALEKLAAASDAAALAVDQVGLALDRAGATPTLVDDIAALKEIGAALAAQEAAIRAQIKLNKDDVGLKQELVGVQSQQIANENALASAAAQRARNQKDATREAIRDVEKLAVKEKDAALAARQAAQFRALGLQPTGEELVPTAQNLRDRLGNITDAVKGTFLDTNKTKSLLQKIRRVLAGEFGKISQETRATIKGMLDDIKDQFNATAKGPLTKTSGLNTKKIIEGLGLDADTANQIRSRLSGFNTAGKALAGATASTFRPPVGFGAGAGLGGGTIQVDSTIVLDGAAVGLAVTRHQQKTGRRNPKQKRGPNRIGGV